MKFEDNILKINFREKFTFRRGRINCSLNDGDIWRWLGIQMSIEVNQIKFLYLTLRGINFTSSKSFKEF